MSAQETSGALTKTPTREREARVLSGWVMLPITVLLYVGGPALIVWHFYRVASQPGATVTTDWWVLAAGIIALLLAVLLSPGFFALQPNEARVLILFGSYRGTARQVGFRWGNPFYSNGPATQSTGSSVWTKSHGKKDGEQQAQAKKLKRYKVSLRARTLNGDKLKVNDRRGNPVDIAAVVVWRVEDTAKAVFDVDDFEEYVATQSETAVRHLASAYPYDSGETLGEDEGEITLRGNVDEVSEALRAELAVRLAQAGVAVEQARLTHLAYAPEIAQAMLRRQQAEAVIAARRKIVMGATSMVEMALNDLSDKHVVDFDEERKAAMISNLMVVLCGETQVTPVVNTGTLYQ
jgi:regulator of protease activity HflC (stomatin/prohibitin superfamily)